QSGLSCTGFPSGDRRALARLSRDATDRGRAKARSAAVEALDEGADSLEAEGAGRVAHQPEAEEIRRRAGRAAPALGVAHEEGDIGAMTPLGDAHAAIFRRL